MNKKQIYNKGVESGLKVSQKIIEQEVEAMGYLKGKINLIVDGHDEMKDAVNRLIKDADDDAISNLFHVCNTATPSELKEHEKKVLLSVLATLSKNMINENQRQYQNNLRHHINMKGYQPDSDYDFKSIATLESVKSIKVIAKAVRVFLYLENDSMDSVFQYDEELFSHFEIRGFDEIDAQIELLVHLFGNKGLIELYGDYENKGDFVQKDLSFLHPKEKEYVEINRECAHIYFKDCYSYDEGLKYIESSSFIIFSSGNKIMKLNKVTGVADILLSNIEKASIYIDKKKISTYFDMVYYVMNNDLHYFNLETDATGIIAHIPEEKNAEGELYEIRELSIYKGKKVIYQNGYRHYIMDMEVGTNPISFSVGSESDNYFIKGDYLFYVDMEADIDDLDHTKYVIKKYGLINNQATTISKPFGKHKALDVDGIYAIYELYNEGMYKNKYFSIFSYSSMESMDRIGFQCFWVNVDSDYVSEIHNFYIWQARVYQMEQYKNKLIYVNADKGYSLMVHDFETDKKQVLVKGYGETEKSSLTERWILGKGEFQKPYQYMRLGKWIWYKKKGKNTPEIVSIS